MHAPVPARLLIPGDVIRLGDQDLELRFVAVLPTKVELSATNGATDVLDPETVVELVATAASLAVSV